MVHKLLKIFIISVILLKMVKHSDFHLSFFQIVGALPGFKPWGSRYESVNYGISNY